MSDGLKVIMWEWRDGSIHAEMRLLTFMPQGDDATDHEFVTHLAGDWHNDSACGERYRYRGPCSSGLGRVGAVDCPACRDLIRGTRFVLKQDARPLTERLA